jgi:hypothetical protein
METIFGFLFVALGLMLVIGIIIESVEKYYEFKQRRKYED